VSIEGPGGIGKSFLLDHVVSNTDLSARAYLTIRANGNDSSSLGTVHTVAKMIEGASFNGARIKSPSVYFPSVSAVTTIVESIRAEAVEELEKQPQEQGGSELLLELIDRAISVGKSFNSLVPATKDWVNAEYLAQSRPSVEEFISTCDSLRTEALWFWERLGIGGRTALRNAIKENCLDQLSKAMTDDLSSVLAGRHGSSWWMPRVGKAPETDRLLLIIDDYEKLQRSLGTLLTEYLIPALDKSDFETVIVVLGRDQLKATSTEWDRYHVDTIELDRLSRSEMDRLVEAHGVAEQDEKDRAWQDTEGYPFYVELWVEEAESGGRSALMLKRFYDRTTRWMDSREKRWLDHVLFLDVVDKRCLRAMLGNADEAEQAFDWFENEGSVRDTKGETYRVRPYLRSRLGSYVRNCDPDRFSELTARGRSCIEPRS
jgi:hypothetical protein